MSVTTATQLRRAARTVTACVESLTGNDYAFSIDAVGETWEVYYKLLPHDAVLTIALRFDGAALVVGVFMPVKMQKDAIALLLEEDAHGAVQVPMTESVPAILRPPELGAP